MRQRNSMRNKMIPAFFAASCIPILIFALISQIRLWKSTETLLKTRADEDIAKANQCLDMILDKYETILYDVTTDDEFITLVEEINENKEKEEVNGSKLRRQFAHVCNRHIGVEGMQVVLKSQKRFFYDRFVSSSVESSWILQVPVERIAVQTYYVDPVQSGTQEHPVFHILRKIIDYRNINKEIGYVILSVDLSVLTDAIVAGNTEEEGNTYLISENRIFLSPSMQKLGQNPDSISKKGMYTLQTENTTSGWEILLVWKMDAFYREIMAQFLFWTAVAFVILVLLIILLSRFTRPIRKSVSQIVEAMEQMEAGNFQIHLSPGEKDSLEIQKIREGLNALAEHTDDLIRQVKQSAIEQKNAEISALEAQIDPHFLYNILDTINWKAIENEQYEISELLVSLADILRYAIKNPGEETSLQAEQEWLEKYLLLQQAKLGEPIQAEFYVEEELQKYKIHKLLLQPFVENAVKYGFHGKEGEHKIKIQVQNAGQQIHIVIENNGIPMTTEEIKELNAGQEQKNHVGIANVRKRLKLYYGEETKLYFQGVEREQEIITQVHLFLPCEGKEYGMG